ncbi:hypothetical protein BN946_scf184977.g113 [Trametes cinnabarina]|uniref:Uncharacterized protein n=1 Tax=Pycnoporus cinnabarinus TaxID=5643 RepID=A0A060SJM3_PYCCI|nr:hypothetical protein BN946_scf184977.g113 [Trametes cinnabarina]
MSTRRNVEHRFPTRPRLDPSANPTVDYLAMSLQERFAIFDAFARKMARDDSYLSPPATISPRVATAARRCVKRVPVPIPPTVPECPEEEEDYLEEAESTTACDEWSPVYASFRDKPLPNAPHQDKALPPTPPSRNKGLPPLPLPSKRANVHSSQVSKSFTGV